MKGRSKMKGRNKEAQGVAVKGLSWGDLVEVQDVCGGKRVNDLAFSKKKRERSLAQRMYRPWACREKDMHERWLVEVMKHHWHIFGENPRNERGDCVCVMCELKRMYEDSARREHARTVQSANKPSRWVVYPPYALPHRRPETLSNNCITLTFKPRQLP